MKDEFLATLSHELRTPLSAILGWTYVLRRHTAAGDPEISEGLGVIERNARVQVQLVEDLLDMSRIISGKIRLDVQPVALAEVLEASYETVRPAADAKGVRIRKVIDPLAGPVSGDPNRLQQVVWNLLNNAVKFTPRRTGGFAPGPRELACGNHRARHGRRDHSGFFAARFRPLPPGGRHRRAAATAGWGWGFQSSNISWNCTAVRCAISPGLGKGSTFVVELPVAPIRPETSHGSIHQMRARIPRQRWPGKMTNAIPASTA